MVPFAERSRNNRINIKDAKFAYSHRANTAVLPARRSILSPQFRFVQKNCSTPGMPRRFYGSISDEFEQFAALQRCERYFKSQTGAVATSRINYKLLGSPYHGAYLSRSWHLSAHFTGHELGV